MQAETSQFLILVYGGGGMMIEKEVIHRRMEALADKLVDGLKGDGADWIYGKDGTYGRGWNDDGD